MTNNNNQNIDELKYNVIELIKQAIPMLTTDEAKELASIIYNNRNDDPKHLMIDYMYELAKKEGGQRGH